MKKVIFTGTLLLLTVALFTSCKKAGLGGTSTISGAVMHHDDTIPNAMVYIKFNATNSAGTDVSVYDHSVAADSMGNYAITELKAGSYFVYGTGFDPGISENVTGGVPVKIAKNGDTVTLNVPVTE